MTNVKNGNTIMIRITEPKKLPIMLDQPLSVDPRLLSQISTSFVNLLTILPIGVVSKNAMGPRTIQSNIALCIDLEAFNAVRRNTALHRYFYLRYFILIDILQDEILLGINCQIT